MHLALTVADGFFTPIILYLWKRTGSAIGQIFPNEKLCIWVHNLSMRNLCRRGLYRGLSLNYLKTMPNVAIYMSLYDFLKIRLTSYLGQ
jgi:hypothetical protein